MTCEAQVLCTLTRGNVLPVPVPTVLTAPAWALLQAALKRITSKVVPLFGRTLVSTLEVMKPFFLRVE